MSIDTRWHSAPKEYDEGTLAARVFDYVRQVETSQSYLFERFYRLSCLYDPYFARLYGTWAGDGSSRDMRVSENVVASNVDTVVAVVAASEVRPRFLTDDGDWTEKRTAERLSWYAEGLARRLGIHGYAVEAFKDSALKGTGLVKVWADKYTKTIRLERVLVDDIIIDESECRTGQPRQMHQRAFVDRDALKAAYPDYEDKIDAAQRSSDGTGIWTMWADYRPIEDNQLVVLESWYLPHGDQPGRHVITIDGCELLDEEWSKPSFPFAVMRWTSRAVGWYGIGGAERIAGHQRRLNKLHWQIDRLLDLHAMPTTYVHQADAALAVKSRNEFGTIGVYKAAIPQTIHPPAVSGETYARLERVKEGSYEEFGVSRMAASAAKPAGLDSGVALREYRDQTTQRFAMQEKAFEQLVLDCVLLCIDAAKDLKGMGIDPPRITKRMATNSRKIRWSDVDVDLARVQLYAAATLSRTPAGRQQSVMEYAQAGVITLDEARRMLHPFDSLDLTSTISAYQAALDNIELTVQQLLDGEEVLPEPYQNLELGIRYVNAAYLRAVGDGAPEEVQESLRDWSTNAAAILNPPQPPQLPPSPMAGPEDMGGDPYRGGPVAQGAADPTANGTPATQLAAGLIG